MSGPRDSKKGSLGIPKRSTKVMIGTLGNTRVCKTENWGTIGIPKGSKGEHYSRDFIEGAIGTSGIPKGSTKGKNRDSRDPQRLHNCKAGNTARIVQREYRTE